MNYFQGTSVDNPLWPRLAFVADNIQPRITGSARVSNFLSIWLANRQRLFQQANHGECSNPGTCTQAEGRTRVQSEAQFRLWRSRGLDRLNIYIKTGQSENFILNFNQLRSLCPQIWRAVRLIVDTGLHYKGMKREEAIKMFGDFAWDDSDFTQKEVGNCP